MSNTRQAKAKARIAASLKSRAIAVISDAKKAGDVYVTCTFNGKGSKHVTKVFAAAAIKFSGLSQLDLAKKANVRKHTVGTALAKGTTTTTTLIDIVRAAELNFSIIATPKKTSTKKPSIMITFYADDAKNTCAPPAAKNAEIIHAPAMGDFIRLMRENAGLQRADLVSILGVCDNVVKKAEMARPLDEGGKLNNVVRLDTIKARADATGHRITLQLRIPTP